MDEGTARAVLVHAADRTRRGDIHGATGIIITACMAGAEDACPEGDASVALVIEASALVVRGAQLCATVLREQAGSSHPECVTNSEFYSIELSTPDGMLTSFDAIHEAPSAATSLRCVGAALNGDFDMLAVVLKTHLDTHGLVTVFDIVGDLVNYFVMFSGGMVG